MRPDTLTDGDGQPAAGLDAFAHISLQLDTLTTELRRQYSRREKLWAHLHPVQITGPQLDTLATPPVLSVDRPDILGPHTGYHWDIRRLSFAPADPAAMWQGRIWVYKGLAAGASLIDVFDAAQPIRRYGKAYLMLSPHERLVFAAGPDFTGVAQPGGEALLVVDECVPVYLT